MRFAPGERCDETFGIDPVSGNRAWIGTLGERPQARARCGEKPASETTGCGALCWLAGLRALPCRYLPALKKTPMANVVRDPREHPDAIIPDLSTNHIAPFTRDQVAFVYGSVWKTALFCEGRK